MSTVTGGGGSDVFIEKIEEGGELDKSSLNRTRDSWDKADGDITGGNIREEGLDRRVFSSSATWSDRLSATARCQTSHFLQAKMPPKDWAKFRWLDIEDGHAIPDFTGGYGDGSYPAIEWEWDPQEHSYCILRASFYFEWDIGVIGDQGRFSRDQLLGTPQDMRSQRYVKFGICAGRDLDMFDGAIKGTRRLDNTEGNIHSQGQMGLNRDWSTYTNRVGPIRKNYDRRAKMTSSFTLIAGGSSGENRHTYDLTDNACALDMSKAGTYRAHLCWKGHSINDGEDGKGPINTIDGSGFNGKLVYPKFGHLQFYAQVFRR